MSVSESQIIAKGREIFSKMGSAAPQLFNTKWWHGKIMDWCMSNPAFKVEMFRFVDVMPCLKTTDQVGRHLREYFCRPGLSLPPGVQTVLGGITASSLITKIAALTIQKNTRDMARMFIAGANPDDAIKELHRLRKSRLAFTVDLLGEAAVSEEESDEYQRRYLELLDVMAAEAKTW
jgi:RHH-type proline utilization regulon transcriptional repressor/proline dehydrogenase/delta 1-pyrroline-5-carboxylate dehydrogenase